MFAERELEITKLLTERKIEDILANEKKLSIEDFEDLSILFKLKDKARSALGY